MPKPFPHAYLYNEGLKFSYLLAKSGGKHMAVYRNVQVNFWQDEFILDLTPRSVILHIFVNWYENEAMWYLHITEACGRA